MLKGICPKCGKVFYGWALQNPEHQHCECGALLLIFDERIEQTEEGRRNRDFCLERARQLIRESGIE